MSYDLIVEGIPKPATSEPWIEGLRAIGLEVTFAPGPWEDGWLPARVEVPDDSALLAGLRRAAADQEDLEGVVAKLEAMRAEGPVRSGFLLHADDDALTFSFGARDPASVPLLAFCTALVAARGGGTVMDPQTGLTFDPSDAVAALGTLVEEEFDLFLADAPEIAFDGW